MAASDETLARLTIDDRSLMDVHLHVVTVKGGWYPKIASCERPVTLGELDITSLAVTEGASQRTHLLKNILMNLCCTPKVRTAYNDVFEIANLMQCND